MSQDQLSRARLAPPPLIAGLCIVAALLVLPVPRADGEGRKGATIEGTVESSSGAIVVNANVTLRGTDRSVRLSAVSNDGGRYRFKNVRDGVYQISVDRTGYAHLMKSHVVIQGNQSLIINFTLAPAKRSAAESPLGGLSFYDDSSFSAGQLTDPAAGGGYSDAASAQGGLMVEQYLAAGARQAENVAKGDEPAGRAGTSEASYASAGAALLARRDFGRAQALFNEAVTRYPESGRLRTGLGLALFDEGRYEAAANALSDAARLSPDDPSPHLLLAEAGRFAPRSSEKAARVIAAFVARHPESAAGHYAYGLELWNESRRDSAALEPSQAELERAVALDPALAAARVQLGIVYDRESKLGLAMEQYRAAIASEPDLTIAHYRLAEDAERSGDKQEAREEFQAYRRLRSGSKQP